MVNSYSLKQIIKRNFLTLLSDAVFLGTASCRWDLLNVASLSSTVQKEAYNRNSQRQGVWFWLLNPVSFLWPYIIFCQASQGLQDIQHHRPAPEKEAGTIVPSGPYPGPGDTTGASLTNCPCLAAWENGDCSNCIFPSNCICHMWGLLLWSQVWGLSQWCVKLNSWTLTCTTRRRCAGKRPEKRAINYAVAQNISRAAVESGTEATARRRHAAGPLKLQTWSWRSWLSDAV